MISFEPDEEQALIKDMVRKLADEKLWPRLRDTEAARALPVDVAREAAELGLGTLALPEDVGGQGLGLVTSCLVEEELARGDLAACFALPGPGNLAHFVVELGDEAQRREVLGPFLENPMRRGAVAFSEARPAERPGLSTTAVAEGDGYRVCGDKCFVLNGGVADSYLVVAQLDPEAGFAGLGAFVVPGDAEGVKAGPRRKPLGIDAAHIADVSFDVVVPKAARLLGASDFSVALARAFARVALLNAARAVGVAGRAFELTHDYTQERKAFGKPVGHFQAVAFTVADRLMDVEGSRWLTWRAAARWDAKGAPKLGDVAAAAATALEMAVRCGDDGVQLFGGAGFVRDYPIEKLFRDARMLSLMGPTTEALDQLLASEELGLPDPALILPTPDIQPVCV